MNLDAILAARALLNEAVTPMAKKGPGRPKKAPSTSPTKTAKKRVLSDEARSKIAAAQKKRWAAAKKANK